MEAASDNHKASIDLVTAMGIEAIGSIMDYKRSLEAMIEGHQCQRIYEKKADAEEDIVWIFRNIEGPGTFLWFCQVTGTNPEIIRRHVRRIKQEIRDIEAEVLTWRPR